MTSTEHHMHKMGSPVIRHGIDPTAGVELLVEIWNDHDRRVQTRPIGADGWTAWSPPVALTEVAAVRA
jgi:hypothetical protein